MNRKFVVSFASVCIAAAVLSAASVAYRVLAGDAAGRRAARADFEGLRSVLAYVKTPSDLADASLRARLASRYEASPSILLIDVYERGAGDRWRIPADSPYLPASRSGGSLPAPLYPPASTILLSAPLKGDSSGTLAVDALYASLTQAAAFEACRDALIGLGAFLALAALVLAFVSGTGDSVRVQTARPSAGKAEAMSANELAAAAAEYQYDTLSPEEPPREEARRGPSPAATGISIKARPEPAEEEFDIPIMMDDSRDIRPEAIPDTSPEARPETLLETQPEACPESGLPEGLYSPASGLGWESYMKERLDAEISRSASFEQDLSLLVLSYDDLSVHDRHYATIGKTIEDFFSFRDLAFERGGDGFAVILPNIDTNHALRMAEEFYKKLVFLADGDFSELELLPLFMGISSRSGRLIDASRIVEEAAAALDKARYEKDTRIVAFRPDPDKYRLFLASKGA